MENRILTRSTILEGYQSWTSTDFALSFLSKGLTEEINRKTITESNYRASSTFLSHKHDDDPALLHWAIDQFQKLSSFVYLDWQDPYMPKTTSADTAIALRSKIQQNKKFVLLATEKAVKSPWCNWELGFADLAKKTENVAILPINEQISNNPTGHEYLGIYSFITYRENGGKYEFFVENGNQITPLRTWLLA